MKNHIVIAATIAALLSSSVAMADSYDHKDYHDDHHQSQKHDDHYDRHDNDRHDNGHHDNGHHWKRGDRIDDRYRGGAYAVSDYRNHHLHQPPHGYRWVRDDDNNYLLVAVASGVIASIILGAGR